jgi:proteasome lid subunit RPN8/RPN11
MMAAPFYLTKAVFDEIIAHAREGKPQEVCGILRGRGNSAFELVRGRNVAPDPVMDYVIDSQTLLRQFDFEEGGDEMVAVYHSHPVSPAYPSGSDAWNAHYPDVVYIICSLEGDAAPDVRGYRLQDHDVSLAVADLKQELEFDETRPGRFALYQAEDAPLPPQLDPACAGIPKPFYIVFEIPDKVSKKLISRVVSVIECDIQVAQS